MTENVLFLKESSFPDDTDNSGDNDFSDAIHWRDVPKGTWFYISKTLIINANKIFFNTEDAMIARLQKRNGTYIKAWLTAPITKYIGNLQLKVGSNEKKLFIKSLGKKKCNKWHDDETFYYDYRIKLL